MDPEGIPPGYQDAAPALGRQGQLWAPPVAPGPWLSTDIEQAGGPRKPPTARGESGFGARASRGNAGMIFETKQEGSSS